MSVIALPILEVDTSKTGERNEMYNTELVGQSMIHTEQLNKYVNMKINK